MDSKALAAARETYNLAQWSGGYFDLDAAGHVVARPGREPDGPAVDLLEVVAGARRAGLSLPVLVRFVDILHDRVRSLCCAFDAAMAADAYQGRYTAVYPIKVNQQRRVVEEILDAAPGRVGLEAGSKPELMAVLAIAPAGCRVICNGYKDREYLRLALRALQLGLDCWIVVEKLSEVEAVVAEAARLGVIPRLGLRVRLAAIGEGRWQNTGGERGKFGLTAAQALEAVERLRAAGLRESLGLLHFHLGSQIPNIADIQRGLREAARYYAELRRLGAPLACVDVGGGLGVDYEGTRSRSFCSLNYSLEEYAQNVVRSLREICAAEELPEPDIVTECGRAMTAHHAVMVTDVVDADRPGAGGPLPAPDVDAPAILGDLWRGLEESAARSPLESWHNASHWLAEARTMYVHGLLSLQQRAHAERLHEATCARVLARLDPKVRAHRDVLDELREKLADKLFVNLSIFQSMPDIWAIDQIFPILPLGGLEQPASRPAILQDLTCDSDGTIHRYVNRDGIEATLPLPQDCGPGAVLGVFMVGAYQEILGDMHNLFGDTDSVNVELTGDGYRLAEPASGDTVESVLSHVRFPGRDLLQAYRRRVAAADLPAGARSECLRELEAGLQAYTYLKRDGDL